MRPRSIPGVGLLLLCVLIATVTVGCRKPFELSVLDPQSVPAEVRERPVPSETEIVWRVYEHTEEYEFAVYTCVVVFEGRKYEQFHTQAKWLDEDGGAIGSCSGSGDLKPRFWSATGSGSGYDSEAQELTYSLHAYGSALDPTAASHTITGVTTTGRRVEGKVFSGFWALNTEPAEYRENWVSLTATRADGSVVHRYEMPHY